MYRYALMKYCDICDVKLKEESELDDLYLLSKSSIEKYYYGALGGTY